MPLAPSHAVPAQSAERDARASVGERYRERAVLHGRRANDARGRARWISNLRLVVFVGLVLAGSWAASAVGTVRGIAAAVTVVVAGAFVALVVVHRRERWRAAWHDELRTVNELGELRTRRAWRELPLAPVPMPPPTHPYAADLDVVGHASLFQLLDVVSAVPGRPTLLRWLLAPDAPIEVVRERQTAAAELRPEVELREALHALARMAGEVRVESVERFLAWAEDAPWLLRRPVLLWGARVLPVVTLALLVLSWIGIVAWPVLLVPGVAALALFSRARQHLHTAITHASAYGGGLRHTAANFARLAHPTFASPFLQRLQDQMAAGGGAHRQLGRLERVTAWAEVRHSPMLHSALQALFLWDFHVVAALERWQSQAGAHARDWLAALGEAEALVALATLAHDNPGWTFPELRDDGVVLVEAESLAHPLLPAEVRVANDVAVGPPGTCLLITGSNMSGKSTLLRAIGTNLVLAHAGGPVCATRLRTPLVSLYTSIRVQDSLEQGISLFRAELERLKQIVDAARQADPERPLLYLLDEILHGTNTAERQVAARTVLGHLIESGAIGAVTTHDLTLAAAGVLAAAAHPVHFTERFTRTDAGTAMSFDYRLRPGLATSANALRLLEMMGLGTAREEKGERREEKERR